MLSVRKDYFGQAVDFGHSMSIETGRRVLAMEAAAIQACADQLDESFIQAADLIEQCVGRVVTCGVGKSGHIAKKMAATLSSTGTPSHFLHAAEAVHGDLGTVRPGDVVLMYSHSGETDEILQLFAPIHKLGVKVILISGRPDSTAGNQANICLNTHVTQEACTHKLAPTTSTTVMLALSDALAIAVMDRRGFTVDQFAERHPKGSLGKQLTPVRSIMLPLSEIAALGPDADILEVMVAITGAKVGAACIVDADNHLLGLISDGDLRRAIVSNPQGLHAKAESLMNRKPYTIEPDLLADEAMARFQKLERKAGDLPVVENGQVIGLLTLKDLLREAKSLAPKKEVSG